MALLLITLEMKKLVFLLLLALSACTVQKAGNKSDGDSVISPLVKEVDSQGLVLTKGRFGNLINGQSYQQEVLLSLNGWQYITYYDADRQVCLGRRRLPGGEWEIIRFADYHFSHNPLQENDSHNNISMGFSVADGKIHLSFDHHVSELHYRYSKTDVLSKPESVKWETSLFTPVLNYLEKDKKLVSVTYPRFISSPNGNMLLSYRSGGSGKGELYVGLYDALVGEWKNIHPVISGRGVYQGPFGNLSNSRNPYENGLSYDEKGKLHISWCWREGGKNGVGNRDICHIYSPDDGLTWFNYKNVAVASAPSNKVVDTATPDINLKTLDRNWGLMNSQAQATDPHGTFHVVMYHLKEKAAEPAWARINNGAYFHYYRDKRGQLKEFQIPAIGNRPKLLADRNSNLYLIFIEKDPFDRTVNYSGKLKILKATKEMQWTNWKDLYVSEEEYFNEPLIDPERWDKEEVISLMLQDKPTMSSGIPAAIKVMDIDLNN
jgi:hypothetical protein